MHGALPAQSRLLGHLEEQGEVGLPRPRPPARPCPISRVASLLVLLVTVLSCLPLLRNYEEMRQKLSVPEQGLRVAPSRAQLVQAQSQIAEAHAQIALLATDSADTRVAGLRLKTRLAVLKASEAKSNTLAPSFDPKTCKAKKGKNKMATDEWCQTNCGDGDAPLCPLELCLCAPNAALPSHAVPPAEQNDAPKEPRKEEPEQPAMQLQHVERAARADHRQPSRAS